jgi:hypothetical protein
MEHPDTLYRLIRERQAEFEAQAEERRSIFERLARLLGR